MFFSVQLKIVLSTRFRELSHLTVTNLNYDLKKCRALNTGFPVLKLMQKKRFKCLFTIVRP